MSNPQFKKCCAESIKWIWDSYGGSMNIIRYQGNCPKCNHYIGLTQTPQDKANEFLKEFGLI
jgi:hypothetical protein